MMLVDTGPLVALILKQEKDHAKCIDIMSKLTSPLTTTWPVITEAMYLLKTWDKQKALWLMIQRGVVQVADFSVPIIASIPLLMEKYRDIPMDFADASLVALANERKTNLIFTLDSDFEVYRLIDKKPFVFVT